MSSAYSKVERYKTIISVILEEYEIKCHFCGEQLTGDSFYRNKSGKKMDELCWHHIDGNHFNNIKGNKRMAHRNCHLRYHRQKELAEWNNKKEERIKAIKEQYAILEVLV